MRLIPVHRVHRVHPDLKRLAADFRRWRKSKQHDREQIPDELMEKARLAIPTHGVTTVVRAIKVDHYRLTKGRQRGKHAPKQLPASPRSAKPAKATTPPVPGYSRIELPMPSSSPRPVAEIETAAGLKLKVFELSPETVSLLSALTAAGRTP